jgi:Skp family chaperone for outer membrane proteins
VPQAVFDVLTQMGLPGIVIISLGWWINRQDTRILQLQGKLDELQSKRVEDAQKMAGEALELSDALKRQTELLLEIKGGKR